MGRFLWLAAGFVVGALGALAWFWFSYFMYVRGTYCPGEDPDPVIACFPSFGQAPGAWIIHYGVPVVILGLALVVFDLAGQGWKGRRSQTAG